jgi:5-enolpyruvylshikimate-3-phosphate synthase
MEDARNKRNGLSFVKSPSRGDIGIISWGETPNSKTYGDHTVLCLKDNGSMIHTVEGNTGASYGGSQSNGGMVAEKDRSKALFIGFIRVSK